MNKNIFKNRTVVGLICIILSLAICFGITPLFDSALKAQTDIVRVRTDISKGTLITDSMLETVQVGSHNLPTAVLKNQADVIGKYAVADLQSGDYILSGKISEKPQSNSIYLTKLDGKKVAISVTIPSLAAGLSGKLESGDIITILSSNKDTGDVSTPEELRYVEVLAATMSSGTDKGQDLVETNSNDEVSVESNLPATLTLLVNMEQAKALVNLEANNKIHVALVYRGSNVNVNKFLATQDTYFTKEAGSNTQNAQ
jgi:pilus assembly protein CpaB